MKIQHRTTRDQRVSAVGLFLDRFFLILASWRDIAAASPKLKFRDRR